MKSFINIPFEYQTASLIMYDLISQNALKEEEKFFNMRLLLNNAMISNNFFWFEKDITHQSFQNLKVVVWSF